MSRGLGDVYKRQINISGSNQAVKIINGVDRGSEENIFEKFL